MPGFMGPVARAADRFGARHGPGVLVRMGGGAWTAEALRAHVNAGLPAGRRWGRFHFWVVLRWLAARRLVLCGGGLYRAAAPAGAAD